MSTFFFYLLSAIAVLGGLITITRRNPLTAALSLVVVFVAFAGLYAMLVAPLLALLQILVYAGAIMALVVFVLMFLNVREENLPAEGAIYRNVGIALLVLLPIFYFLVGGIRALPFNHFDPVPDGFGGIEQVGMTLFTQYVLPFEVISILLTVALVGVVVLAKRKI